MKKIWLARAASLALSVAMVTGLSPLTSLAAEAPTTTDAEPAIEQGAETSVDPTPALEQGADADKDEADAAPVLPVSTDDESAARTPAPASDSGIVYLDGVNGSDANDGTSAATAVKTFSKAKELLGSDGTEIRMVNTVTITGAETWTLGEGQVVIRDESFTCGPMIHVNAGIGNFTLNSIVIDGGYGTVNQGAKGSGSYQQGGAIIDMNYAISQPSPGETTLLLGPTAVLRNNHVVSGEGGQTWNIAGGGIYARSSSSYGNATIMLYGTIDNCSALNEGGGIALSNGSRLRLLTGSAITNCTTDGVGGGVFVSTTENKQSSVTQTGGTISNCTSGNAGGGVFVSLSTYYLYGGELDSNVAGTQGGGICLYDGAACVVSGETDAPVKIVNNVSRATNPNDNGNPVMGGGAIYVDTTSHGDSGYRVSALYLDPAVITGNHAAVDGGGVSLCPDGEMPLEVGRSLAIYGNSTDKGNAEDLVVVRHDTTTSDGYRWSIDDREGVSAYVSPTMLGDGAYHWLDPNGSEYPLDKLQHVGEFFGTSSVSPDSPEAQAAQGLATVIIEGNSSNSFGGGIACNGRMFFSPYSKTDGGTVSLTINKTWADDTEDLRPESLRFNVLRDGEKISYVDVTPDEDGNWSVTIPDLLKSTPDGTHDYEYTIEEEAFDAPGEYKAGDPTFSTDADGNVTAAITNTHIAPITTKFSKRDVAGNELSGAKMQLLDAEGNVIEEWVSDGSNKEIDLASGTYTLHEETAPDGYKVATDISFVVDAEARTVTLVDSQTVAESDLIVMVDDAIPTDTPDKPNTPDAPGKPKTPTTTTATPSTGDATTALAIAVAGAAVACLAVRRFGRDA